MKGGAFITTGCIFVLIVNVCSLRSYYCNRYKPCDELDLSGYAQCEFRDGENWEIMSVSNNIQSPWLFTHCYQPENKFRNCYFEMGTTETNWTPCSVDCGMGQQQKNISKVIGLCPHTVTDTDVNFCGCCTTRVTIEEQSCGICYYGNPSADRTVCECIGRHYGNCCEYEIGVCTTIPADAIFVLDSSISQTEQQFKKQLDFIINFSEHVSISNENFQIGVVTFSTSAQVEIDINQNLTKAALQDAVRKIPFRPGATFTNKGLATARAALSQRGKRINKDGYMLPTVQYVFVLTDGLSNLKVQTQQEANLLKNKVDKVIAIGIGVQVSHKELQDIASSPDQQSLSYVFSVDNFNALNTVIRELVNVTCERCSRSNQSDIVFLIDRSASITWDELQIAINDVIYMIQNAPDIGQPNGQNVAVITFNTELEYLHTLQDGQNKDNIVLALQTVTRGGGYCDMTEKATSCDSLNITQAIIDTSNQAFTTEKGGRSEARKLLIAFTNGKFPDNEKVKSIMGKFNNESDVRLSVIGLGEDVSMQGLLSLVDDANHVFLTQDKTDQAILNVLINDFRYNVCNMTET